MRFRKPKKVGEKVSFEFRGKPVTIVRERDYFRIHAGGWVICLPKNTSAEDIAREIFKKFN